MWLGFFAKKAIRIADTFRNRNMLPARSYLGPISRLYRKVCVVHNSLSSLVASLGSICQSTFNSTHYNSYGLPTFSQSPEVSLYRLDEAPTRTCTTFAETMRYPVALLAYKTQRKRIHAFSVPISAASGFLHCQESLHSGHSKDAIPHKPSRPTPSFTLPISFQSFLRT